MTSEASGDSITTTHVNSTTTMVNLETLDYLFNHLPSAEEPSLCPGRNPPSPPQQKDDSPAAGVSPPLHIVRTMDNMQVDHGIETMIEETNLDEHGRMKNMPLSYEAKKNEFRLFCDTMYPGQKVEKDTRSIKTR